MQENTNKIIAYNAVLLYIKLIVSVICGLFITRFSLKALGIVDFGLYSVIGSIITFVAIINTFMVSTSKRYIAVAIGKGDPIDICNQFNVCRIIHIVIAIVTLLLALPIGDWYVCNFINYDGEILNARVVFSISVVASAISFIGVPYHGLLTAKENFLVFCIPDIITHVLKLCFTYVLIYAFTNKLLVYAGVMSFFTVFPTIVYVWYCGKKYGDVTKYKFVRDKAKYKEILVFSAWVGYGALAWVGKSQGAALLVNLFFNTVMNTALGIANHLSSFIGQMAQSIAQPLAPQITKTYVSGDRKRCDSLLVFSTKITFLLMLLFSSPFLVECEWVLSLWLGQVPPYAVMFTILIIVDSLIDSLNSGIKNIIFASGNIKLFQIIPSTLKLLSIVAAYFALKAGYPAYSLLYAYILFSVVIFFANQWILKKSVNFDTKLLIKNSYIPSLIIAISYLPTCLLNGIFHPLIVILISVVYILVLIFMIGLSKTEKQIVLSLINKFKSKIS